MSQVVDAKQTNFPIINQDPIVITSFGQIDYSVAQQIAKQSQTKIAKLKINEMAATEENKGNLTDLRTELNKEFKEFEDGRKKIKNAYMQNYLEFEDWYKEGIKKPYENGINLLGDKINSISDEQRKERIEFGKKHFEDNNQIDWLTFERYPNKINVSDSNKKIVTGIDVFLTKISNDVATIEHLPHSERVLALYQRDLDLNRAISFVGEQVKREEEIAKQREAMYQKVIEIEQPVVQEVAKDDVPLAAPIEVQKEQEEVFTLTMKVTGTKSQLIAVREFMREEGIQYE